MNISESDEKQVVKDLKSLSDTGFVLKYGTTKKKMESKMGGRSVEGTPEDREEDHANEKKLGISAKKWEGSPADKEQDSKLAKRLHGESEELNELYFLQPDGKWKNNADGRSKGKTKSEVLAIKGKIEESNNTPFVKPHIEKGSTKQSGWKASNKHGKVKYFGLDFKTSAEKHAGINTQDVPDGLNESDKIDWDEFNRRSKATREKFPAGELYHNIKKHKSYSPEYKQGYVFGHDHNKKNHVLLSVDVGPSGVRKSSSGHQKLHSVHEKDLKKVERSDFNESALNEISNTVMSNYFNKAAMNRGRADKEGDEKTVTKRDKGLNRLLNPVCKLKGDVVREDETPSKKSLTDYIQFTKGQFNGEIQGEKDQIVPWSLKGKDADDNSQKAKPHRLNMNIDGFSEGYITEKNWIAGAIKQPGSLHKELGVPAGKDIPEKKLDQAAHASGKEGERARLALTLKKMHKEESMNEGKTFKDNKYGSDKEKSRELWRKISRKNKDQAKSTNEEVEDLNEISKKTFKRH